MSSPSTVMAELPGPPSQQASVNTTIDQVLLVILEPILCDNKMPVGELDKIAPIDPRMI